MALQQEILQFSPNSQLHEQSQSLGVSALKHMVRQSSMVS